MVPLIILGLLAVTVICLLAALVFLYRYLSRSRLFPQLPRLWRGDKTRALLFFLMFLIFGIGFGAASWLSQPPEPEAMVEQTLAKSQAVLGPSFDGRPPPAPSPAPPMGQTAANQPEERVLPPAAPQGQPPAPGNQDPQQALPQAQEAGAQPSAAPPPEAQAGQAVVSSSETTTSTTTSSTTTSTTTTSTTTTSSSTTAPPTTRPKARTSKVYTACAASFRDRASADKRAAQLGEKGFSAQVVEVNLKEKGRWFRVCVGEFPNPAQAQAEAKRLKEAGLAGSPFPARLP